MKNLPLARTADIVVQELGKEILVYDLNNHKAFNLNETSSVVYKSCDGFTSFDELKTKYKFTDDLIYLALDQLKEENLLEENYTSPFSNISRRTVIKRVGLATMAALPVIASLVSPTAAMAQSGCAGAGCTASGCPVGVYIDTFGGATCADTAFTDFSCQLNFGTDCCSGNAVTDTCNTVSANQIRYTCKCA